VKERLNHTATLFLRSHSLNHLELLKYLLIAILDIEDNFHVQHNIVGVSMALVY